MAKTQFQVTREELSGLQWVVQVRDEVCRRYESMAAFNVRSIAISYAEKAKTANPRHEYRVLELSTIQPTHTIIFETPATATA